jgi:hypothetical protein
LPQPPRFLWSKRSPARSIAFHKSGGGDPVEVAERLLADAENWLATSGIEPVPTSYYEPAAVAKRARAIKREIDRRERLAPPAGKRPRR